MFEEAKCGTWAVSLPFDETESSTSHPALPLASFRESHCGKSSASGGNCDCPAMRNYISRNSYLSRLIDLEVCIALQPQAPVQHDLQITSYHAPASPSAEELAPLPDTDVDAAKLPRGRLGSFKGDYKGYYKGSIRVL